MYRGRTSRLKSGKRIITVDLNAVHWKASNPGDIFSVTIEVPGAAAGSQPAASFSVALTDKQESCAVYEVRLEGSAPTSRIIQMQPLDQSDLLDEELEVYGHDIVYEDALTVVGALIRGTKHTSKSTPISHKVSSGEPISAAQATAAAQPPEAGG